MGALEAYGRVAQESTPVTQVGEELLERAALYADGKRDPDRVRIALYHVLAWVRLWPDGEGKEAAEGMAASAVALVERVCQARGRGSAPWGDLAGTCRRLAEFLQRARSVAERVQQTEAAPAASGGASG